MRSRTYTLYLWFKAYLEDDRETFNRLERTLQMQEKKQMNKDILNKSYWQGVFYDFDDNVEIARIVVAMLEDDLKEYLDD